MLPYMNRPLPDYDNPPVVETVLGLQFEPLPRMSNAHLGAFWKSLPPEWVAAEDAPSLEPQFENFTDAPNWGAFRFKLSSDLSSRVQLRNEANDRMVQIQNGRLHVNWLGHGGSEYPRYNLVRDGVIDAFNRFSEFAMGADLGEIRANQWEVTYVNRIEKGTVWETPNDWHFFRLLSDYRELNSVRLESFGGEWHFEIVDRLGRLHVHFRHIRRADAASEEAIVLTLTARGPAGQARNDTDWKEGLDLGHKAIVTSFRDLMSDAANEYWGLKHGDR